MTNTLPHAARSLLAAAAVLAVTLPAVARADIILGNIDLNSSVSGAPPAPAGVTITNLDLSGVTTTPSAANYTTQGVQISAGQPNPNWNPSEAAEFVKGSVANLYAAPVTSGASSNVTTFSGTYLSTGTASISMTFATSQRYLGLLWGSVGSGDVVTLYDGSNLVGTVTGPEVMQTSGYNAGPDGGARGPGGSVYTLINDMDGSFNKAVFSQTGGPSFEFAQVQFATQNVSVPEPTSAALLGVGLLGLIAVPMLRRTVR